jgi:hypothetical protein
MEKLPMASHAIGDIEALVPHLYYSPHIAKDIDLPEDLIGLRGRDFLPASIQRLIEPAFPDDGLTSRSNRFR